MLIREDDTDPPVLPLPRWVIWLAVLAYVALVGWAAWDRGVLDPFALDSLWQYEIPADVDRSRLVTVRPW